MRDLRILVAGMFTFVLTVCGTSVGANVGVYYYPWYGSFAGGHGFDSTLRMHLSPAQPPALGSYSSRDGAAIASHIDQSVQANVDFWAVSWWGPNSAENRTQRDYILTNPRASELKYAVHYESTGRLGTFDSPNFSNLTPDFRYLASTYFQNPNYLKINGRPVVFMYVTRAYFNTAESRTAVANLRTAMQAEFGINPYIVGDDVFGSNIDVQRAQLWDAITDFDVYGTVMQGAGSTATALTNLAGIYDSARNAANSSNIGFIPTASPGFNDAGVRSGHPAAPRYMTDDANSTEGLLFKRMLNEVVVPKVDPKADNILMINSFNEWHEDTQIERTIVAPRTNNDDSANRTYSQGYYYTGYGDLYLNILRGATATLGDYNFDGKIDAADYVVWRKTRNQTGLGLAADGNLNNQIDAGDYAVWRSHFGATAASAAAVALSVPETRPEILVLLILGGLNFRETR